MNLDASCRFPQICNLSWRLLAMGQFVEQSVFWFRWLYRSTIQSFPIYWRTQIVSHRTQLELRILIYLAYTLMAGGAAFAALRVFELHRGSFVILQFQGMYAWHTAMNFGICFIVLDLALEGICHWHEHPRTVGLTWLTGFCSFLIGFILQRTIVYQAITGYYPDLLLLYQKFPSMRPQMIHMFFFCLPFWLITFSFTVWLLLRLQRHFIMTTDTAKPEAPPLFITQNLQVTTDCGIAFLPLHAITHISMNDHYANIYLQENEGCRKVFVRMTLQQALAQLPEDQFVQIHRSHLINLHHLMELRKTGRSWESIIGQERRPLPVSRNRQRDLLDYLRVNSVKDFS